MCERLSTVVSQGGRDWISTRWPHIRRYLRVNATGQVDHDYLRWHLGTVWVRLPCQEVAAACEEWADYFEWRLAQRAAELAGDRLKRHLVAEWTDDMAYLCRQSAAWARGDDPGEWIPQRQRRPDIHAEGRAIVDKIIALNTRRQPSAPEDRRLRRVG